MASRKEERDRMRQERLDAQRAAASADKRRLYLGYGVAAIIVVAIVAGIFVAITGGGDDERQPGVAATGEEYPELAFIQDEIGAVPDGIEVDGREGTAPPEPGTAILEDAAEAADCDLELNLEDEGNQHLRDEDVPNVEYETDPPTSGDHYAGNETGAGALADGAYLEYPPVGRSVHALEHGRVAIQYSPDLSEEEQLEIKGVFDAAPSGVILFPNPEMPQEVAVTAWTQLASCDTYEGAATLDVISTFRDVYLGQGPEFFPLSL